MPTTRKVSGVYLTSHGSEWKFSFLIEGHEWAVADILNEPCLVSGASYDGCLSSGNFFGSPEGTTQHLLPLEYLGIDVKALNWTPLREAYRYD